MRAAPSVIALGAAALLALPVAAQEGGMEHGEMDHGEHEGMMMPEAGLRAELAADLEALEAKYVGLAEAMDDWDWRPGEGVRSAGEVLGHVASANMMFPTMVGIEAPPAFRGESRQETMGNLSAMESVTDREAMMENLRHSFMHARHAIARIPDERLDEPVTVFGQEGTVRSLLTMMVTHNHEHLGQLIAYARTNGVVPPWSGGGE